MGTLGTHRTRSRWLPGADSLVGQHSPFGFSTCPDTWLPMPPEWAALTAEKQRADAGSTLSFFRLALRLRRERNEFDGDVDWLAAPDDALIFRRHGGVWCARSTPLSVRWRCRQVNPSWPAHR